MAERIGSYIPNEPLSASKQGSPSVPGEDVKKRRNSDGGDSSSKSPAPNSSKKVTRSFSTPQSGMRVSGVGSVSQTPATPGSEDGASNRKAKIWKVLMNNINRSVDELYYLCEDEGDEFKCKEVISMFERAGHDFDKLIDRIGEQRKFEANQTSGVSWEVRKPTSSTYLAEIPPGAFSDREGGGEFTPVIITAKSSGGERTDVSASKGFFSRVRAAALPYNPTTIASIGIKGPANVSREKTSSGSAYQRHNESGGVVLVERAGNCVTVSQQTEGENILDDSDVAVNVTESGKRALNLSRESDKDRERVAGKERERKPLAPPLASSQKQTTSNTTKAPTKKGAGESRKQSGGKGDKAVARAERKVAARQDKLEGSHSGKDRAASKPASTSTSTSTSTSMDAVESPTHEWDADTKAQVAQQQEEVWLQAEAWIEAEAEAEEEEWKKLDSHPPRRPDSARRRGSAPRKPGQVPSPPSLTLQMELIDGTSESLGPARDPGHMHSVPAAPMSPSRASQVGGADLLTVTPGAPAGRKAGSRPTSASRGGGGEGTPLSGGRSLHDKLSSPDRRRALSPSEAMRRHEARQIAAESNRESELALRIEKASIASARVKLVGEMKAAQRAEQEQALEDRMLSATKRHGEHIRSIKGKAGNENNKVNEVKFLNNLNDQLVAEELQRRLAEVEARTLAAWQRKQDMLSEIATKHQKRSAKKTQQMSALRLQLEQQKMERWQRLQTRLSSVQARREARMAEMQRRRDEREEATDRESFSAATTPAKADSVVMEDAPAPEGGPAGAQRAARARRLSTEAAVEVSPQQDFDTQALDQALREARRSEGELRERQRLLALNADAAPAPAPVPGPSTASFVMTSETTFTDGLGASSSAQMLYGPSGASGTTATGTEGASVSPALSDALQQQGSSEAADSPPSSLLFGVSTAPGAAEDPRRPHSFHDSFSQAASTQRKTQVSKAKRRCQERQPASAVQMCPLPLSDLLAAPAAGHARAQLRGRCGAIVLHMLHSLGLLSKADVEIAGAGSGSGSASTRDPEGASPAAGVTSTSACRKLRRTFDSCAPFFECSTDGPGRLTPSAVAIILEALLQVGTHDRHAVESFQCGGGVTLLRVLLDPQVGLLSDPELFRAAATGAGTAPGGPGANSFGASTGGLAKAASLAALCCQDVLKKDSSAHFRADCMALGVPLADTAAIMLLHSELFFKALNDAPARPAEAKGASINAAVASRLSLDATPTDNDNKENQGSPALASANGEKIFSRPSPGKQGDKREGMTHEGPRESSAKKAPLGDASTRASGHAGGTILASSGSWLAVDCAALPSLLSALAALVRAPAGPSESHDTATAAARADLIWYLFAANHSALLAHLLRSAQVLGVETSADEYFRALLSAACTLLVAFGWYLRVDAGLARFPGDEPVESVAQLSADAAKKSKHPQAKGLRSLLRINEVPVSLLALLDSILSAAVTRSNYAVSAAEADDGEAAQAARDKGESILGSEGGEASASPPGKERADGGKPYAASSVGQVLSEGETLLCQGVVRALLAIGGADLSLVQRYSDDQQYSLLLSLSQLLRCVVADTRVEEEPRTASLPPYALAEGSGYLIAQILALLGLLCLRNKDMQQKAAKALKGGSTARAGPSRATAGLSSLGARSEPLLLELCREMPMRYFADERFKMQLLPTLVTMCLDCSEALILLRNAISLELLRTHMSRLSRDLEDLKRGSIVDVNSPAQLLQLSARFPTELWAMAATEMW